MGCPVSAGQPCHCAEKISVIPWTGMDSGTAVVLIVGSRLRTRHPLDVVQKIPGKADSMAPTSDSHSLVFTAAVSTQRLDNALGTAAVDGIASSLGHHDPPRLVTSQRVDLRSERF